MNKKNSNQNTIENHNFKEEALSLLRTLKEQTRMTDQEIAEQLASIMKQDPENEGISRSTINRWLNYQTYNIKEENIAYIITLISKVKLNILKDKGNKDIIKKYKPSLYMELFGINSTNSIADTIIDRTTINLFDKIYNSGLVEIESFVDKFYINMFENNKSLFILCGNTYYKITINASFQKFLLSTYLGLRIKNEARLINNFFSKIYYFLFSSFINKNDLVFPYEYEIDNSILELIKIVNGFHKANYNASSFTVSINIADIKIEPQRNRYLEKLFSICKNTYLEEISKNCYIQYSQRLNLK